MDTGFVRKGVASGNCLVGLDRNFGDIAQHLAGREQLLGDNSGVIRVPVRTYTQRRGYFCQGRISSSLANSVDGALDLPRACLHRGQRISHRQPQIIVAVSRNHDFFVLDPLPDHADQRGEFSWNGVTHRVRNI